MFTFLPNLSNPLPHTYAVKERGGVCRQRIIIARAMLQGDILGFAPPLCITKEEIDMVVDGVDKAITEVLG